MGRQIPPVDADALHEVQFIRQRLGFLDGHHAVAAHLFQRIGQFLGDRFLVGRKRGDAGDLLAPLHRDRHIPQLAHHCVDRRFDAGAQAQPVGARRDIPEPLPHDGLGQHHRRGRAVAYGVVGLGGRFFHQLRPQVFVGVGQFHFLGDGHAVAAHHRIAEHPAQHHIAPAGPQSQPHDPPQLLHAAQQASLRFLLKG